MQFSTRCGLGVVALVALIVVFGCQTGGSTTTAFPDAVIGSWQADDSTWLAVEDDGIGVSVTIGSGAAAVFTPDASQASESEWTGTLDDDSDTRIKFAKNGANTLVLTIYNASGGVESTTTYTKSSD